MHIIVRSTLLLFLLFAATIGFSVNRSWIGAGSGGAGTDFNTGTNWQPNGIPTSADDLTMTTTASATVTLSANTTVNNLTLSHSGTNRVFTLDVSTQTLTINGIFSGNITAGTVNTLLRINVGDSPGHLIYGGNATFASSAGAFYGIYGSGGTTGSVTFKGNVTVTNANSVSSSLPANLYFDGTGSQSISGDDMASACIWPANVVFGNVNTPTVTITGLETCFRPAGNVTVSANSTLILEYGTGANGGTLNRSASGGTFTLGAGATLKLNGETGGQTGSNFPSNYTTYSLNATSTVEYNSSDAINQTVYAPVTYGNLILTNPTGSGSSIKSLSANITGIAGNLTVNSFTIFDMATRNANRTTAGGTLSLAANSTLRLSGTTGGASANNNFPSNFSTMTLNVASTTEYYGATQTIYNTPAYGNLTTTTTGNKTAGGNLTIAGNLLINTGTFAGSTFSHTVGGNWTNNLASGYTANTSTVTCNGSAAQTIGGTSSTTFYNLTINNSGSGVTQNTAVTISNIFNLIAGAFNLNSLTAIVTNAAISAITRTSGYIVSETNIAVNPSILQWNIGTITGAHVFPFGTAAGDYIPVTFNNSGAVGNISISTRPTTNACVTPSATAGYCNQPWAGLSNVAAVGTMNDINNLDGSIPSTIDRWWNITSSLNPSPGTTAIPAVTLSLTYLGAENTISPATDILGLQHWNGSLGVWDNGNNGGAGTYVTTGTAGSTAAGPHTVTGSSTLTYFSPYVLSKITAPLAPLPVELLFFTAECKGDKIVASWETASEFNNNYFTLEKSLDGNNFFAVAIVPGAGNSSAVNKYSATDTDPYNGISYYRLTQTDYNGQTEKFSTVAVNGCGNKEGFAVYPNPSAQGGTFNVSVSGNQGDQVLIVVRDMLGQEFYSQVILLSNDTETIAIDPSGKLSSGVYFIVAASDDDVYRKKLVIK